MNKKSVLGPVFLFCGLNRAFFILSRKDKKECLEVVDVFCKVE